MNTWGLFASSMTETLEDWLNSFSEGGLGRMAMSLVIITGVLLVAGAAHLVARTIILKAIRHLVGKTSAKWDDALVERKLFTRMAHLVPAVVFYLSASLFNPPLFIWSFQVPIERLSMAYMIIVSLLVCYAGLNAGGDIYRGLEVSKRNPIKSFLQTGKLLLALIFGVFLIATLTGKDPWGLVAGIGAVTAVLLLVFKDTILGFVASIQIVLNDLVNEGDWIEMPKFGADGSVTDITLTTIKVQNWDKTITTIPSYSVISDSFKNWRGMSQSGGRRIKRSLFLDMNSVQFCDQQQIRHLEQFDLLKDYLKEKQKEIADANKKKKGDTSSNLNQRRLTNLGTFRAYVEKYLQKHPKIHKDMTLLVRQLAPTSEGMPLELYVFTNDTAWGNYEAIQADIFDHLLAILPEFQLRVFQTPTGHDVQNSLVLPDAK